MQHDKDFMKRVDSRIIDIDGSEFIAYTGDYDHYIRQRAITEANIRRGVTAALDLESFAVLV